MKCVYHPEREAVGTCVNCGNGICEFCKSIINAKMHCPNCIEKSVSNTPKSVGESKYTYNRNKLHQDANKQLDKNLATNEKIKVIILGLWESAIIGTETRAFVYKRGLMGGAIFGSKLTSWDYLNLSGVQIETGPLTGVVSLQGPGIQSTDVSYYDTSKNSPSSSPHALSINRDLFEQARDGVAALRTLISSFQKAKFGGSSNTDIPDQIRKLAELREQGILTPEEFEQKKKDLLSRM
jgi:hypothetical protein